MFCIPQNRPLQDRQFDVIVGTLEEAVMDPSFASVQQTFVDEWCGEFYRFVDSHTKQNFSPILLPTCLRPLV